MQIERKRPTAKGPSEWFTGDVYIDPVLGRKDEPSRMACGWVHFTPGARTAGIPTPSARRCSSPRASPCSAPAMARSSWLGQARLSIPRLAKSTGTAPHRRTSWRISLGPPR